MYCVQYLKNKKRWIIIPEVATHFTHTYPFKFIPMVIGFTLILFKGIDLKEYDKENNLVITYYAY